MMFGHMIRFSEVGQAVNFSALPSSFAVAINLPLFFFFFIVHNENMCVCIFRERVRYLFTYFSFR